MLRKSLCLLAILLGYSFTVCYGIGHLNRWFSIRPDSNYVQNNQRDLILRIYASQKYSTQTIHDLGEKTSLDYRPSNGYVLGFGFNYKFLGVNIGTILPFAQPDRDRYGKTKYLDLQSHLYLRIFTVDFYTGYYKGLYLSNSSEILKSYPASGGR